MKNMIKLISVCAFAVICAVLFVACPPEPVNPPPDTGGKEENGGEDGKGEENGEPIVEVEPATIKSLTIAGKEIEWGEPAEELKNAKAKSIYLEYEEAQNAEIEITLDNEEANAFYCIVVSGADQIWTSNGSLTFIKGNVLGIQVITNAETVLYYRFAVSVGDAPPPPPPPPNMTSLSIAGKNIIFGASALDLATASTTKTTLSSTEATNAAISITVSSVTAQALYGIMVTKDSEPLLWKGTGSLTFSAGDILAIKVSSSENEAVLYYKVTISKIEEPPPPPPPPPTSLSEFEERCMTFMEEIPRMYIYTEGNKDVTSKDNYINATINIEGSVKHNISNWEVEIRGRGNSTWNEQIWFDGKKKLPYRIKSVKKTSIFGLPEVKNWALCAEYSDKSLVRNYSMHMLDRSLGTMNFSTNVIYVEVYFNSRYDGLYILKDQMEAKPSRVNVEGFTVDASGNLTDTGFLIVVDWVGRNPGSQNGRDYFKAGNSGDGAWFIKYPKFDDDGFEGNTKLHNQAVAYIKKYVEDVHNALQSSNTGSFDNLCDRNSFVDYYIVQELVKNVDGNKLSIYANKKPGEKMQMGPLWDFDITLGNCYFKQWNTPDPKPEGWQIANGGELNWFKYLMGNKTLYEAVRTRFIELHDKNISWMLSNVDPVRDFIRSAADRNFGRFDKILTNNTWCNPDDVLAANTFDKQVVYLKNWTQTRSDWMYDQLYNRKAISGVITP